MTIDMAAAWYVVHTHPRAEAKALLNLDRQGFSCHLPRYLKCRRHARGSRRWRHRSSPATCLSLSTLHLNAGGRSARRSVSRILS